MDQVKQTSSRYSMRLAVIAIGAIIAVLAFCIAAGGFMRILRFGWMSQVTQPVEVTQQIRTVDMTSSFCGTWSFLTSSDLGAGASQANIGGIAALSPSDVWIAGSKRDVKDNPQLLFLHWDGAHLSPVEGPVLETNNVYLNGISAISHNDIWAVGSDTGRTLITHWSGTSWDIVPSPNVGVYVNELSDVDAITSTDVWAVGYHHPSNRQPLIIHWDGVQWTIVPTPPISRHDAKLYGVKAISTDDVWAVGYQGDDGAEQPLTMHWDGNSWSVVSSTTSCNGSGSLVAVSATMPRDVWAVGNCRSSSDPWKYQTLAMHWDGDRWQTASTDTGNTSQSQYLAQVSAISGSDVWAVGFQGVLRSSGEPLVQHWDGSSWSTIPSSDLTSHIQSFVGVVALSSEEIWAVGKSANDVLLAWFRKTPCAKGESP